MVPMCSISRSVLGFLLFNLALIPSRVESFVSTTRSLHLLHRGRANPLFNRSNIRLASSIDERESHDGSSTSTYQQLRDNIEHHYLTVPKRGITDYLGKTFATADSNGRNDQDSNCESSLGFPENGQGRGLKAVDVQSPLTGEAITYRKPTSLQTLQTRFNLWLQRMKSLQFFHGEPSFIVTSKLTGDLSLQSEADSAFDNLWFSFPNTSPILSSVQDVMSLFHYSAYDPRVQAIYLEIASPLLCGYGKIAEILRAIQFYQKSGKKVIAYLESAGMKEYLIASYCNEIYMPPEGSLDLRGIVSESAFFRDMLDTIGVEPQTYHIGKYKSFGDTYFRSNMSDAQREVTSAILSEASHSWIEQVSQALNKSKTDLWQLWSEDPSKLTAYEYKQRDMITGVRYKNQVEFRLKEEFGKEPFLSKLQATMKEAVNRLNPFSVVRRLFSDPTKKNSSSVDLDWFGNASLEWIAENTDQLQNSGLPFNAFVQRISKGYVDQAYRQDFNLTKDYEMFPRRSLKLLDAVLSIKQGSDFPNKRPATMIVNVANGTQDFSSVSSGDEVAKALLDIVNSVANSSVAAQEGLNALKKKFPTSSQIDKFNEEITQWVDQYCLNDNTTTAKIEKLISDFRILQANDREQNFELECKRLFIRHFIHDSFLRESGYAGTSPTASPDHDLFTGLQEDNEHDDKNKDKDEDDEKQDTKMEMAKKHLFGMTAHSYLRRMKRKKSDSGTPVGQDLLAGFPYKEVSKGPRIGIINAVGTIIEGGSKKKRPGPFQGEVTIGSDSIIKLIHQVKQNPHIKAVVLRIDSPGGSAVASDLVWKEIRELARVKPVIASMVDVAASGGYYFAMACDHIVAEEMTLTGSIGVVAQKFNLQQLQKKLGWNVETISIGKYAELMSNSKSFNDEERESFQNSIQSFYQTFVSKAALGRSKSYEELNEVAQGRVWTGKRAKEVGLVDQIGGLWAAVNMANVFAHIDAIGSGNAKYKKTLKTLQDRPRIQFIRPSAPSPLAFLFENQVGASNHRRKSLFLDNGIQDDALLTSMSSGDDVNVRSASLSGFLGGATANNIDRSVLAMASSEVFHSGLVSPSTLGMTTFLKDLGINAELIASMTAQGYMQNVEALVNVGTGSLKEGDIGGQSMMVWKDLIAKFVDDLKMLSTRK